MREGDSWDCIYFAEDKFLTETNPLTKNTAISSQNHILFTLHILLTILLTLHILLTNFVERHSVLILYLSTKFLHHEIK